MPQYILVLFHMLLDLPQTVITQIVTLFESYSILEGCKNTLVLGMLKIDDIVLDEFIIDDVVHVELELPGHRGFRVV